ncbi:oligosaccharide flippase family protein [Paenibacillus alvei]|uniref:putative polysaccharide biosynthesis protein n=1 Tax=Paenibacillus alvei TaxID=44250 RepID=UPI00227FAAE9|nr:oligosaccharide flippase family protein [Paenibacillus alvei]MCY7485497.1 oligosaccharide flippase family protein [Paenibacillus alvei]
MNKRPPRVAGQVMSGALLLGMATIVSKVIGTLQKIPLQNIGGDGVFGIYNAVYPFYVLLVAIASAGIPVAVARLVAECEAAGDEIGSEQVLLASGLLMTVTGVAVFFAMLNGAEQIAAWIGNQHTEAAIQSSAYALLVMPLAAALRGYDQGRGRMTSTAVSQVVEQTGRVAVMIGLLLYYSRLGAADETIAAGATFGSFAGGVCGLLSMMLFRRREKRVGRYLKRRQVPLGVRQQARAIWGWIRRLTWTALPICLGAIVLPAVNVVDVFTVPRFLLHQGWNEAEALAQFGVYSRAYPLVQLVTMVASSLAVGVVPTVASVMRKEGTVGIAPMIETALRWSWVLGLAATIGLVALAGPLNVALYTDSAGMLTFVLVASTAVSGVFHAVSAALLQGMGAVRAPALHLVCAAIAKAALNIWLIPAYGIAGAAISAAASLGLAAALNAHALAAASGVHFAAWGARSARLTLALGGMAAGVSLAAAVPTWLGASGRLAAVLAIAIGVPLGAAIFALLAIVLGAVRPQELAQLPRIGSKLASIAARFSPRT